MQQLLVSLQSHAQAWAFLQPVNGEEVTDYYDVIKKPMGIDLPHLTTLFLIGY